MRVQEVIARELEPDEKLLWTGVPRQGVALRPADALLIPFSIMWGGFAFFWEFKALTAVGSSGKGAPVFFPLFGLPFVVMGAYIILGRFFVDAKIRAHTFYGVTDHRAIIVSGIWSREVKSLPLRTLSDISITERSDGTGTITLGPAPSFASMTRGTAWPAQHASSPPHFDMIPDAKRVYSLMRSGTR